MTPSERLKQLEQALDQNLPWSAIDVRWLIERCSRYQEALENIKAEAWGPVDLYCKKKITEALEGSDE